MREFEIRISPPIPHLDRNVVDVDLSCLDYAEIAANVTRRYNVAYIVNGRVIEYRPTDITTVLNDLHNELELIEGRLSHDMTLCGYAVLEMVIEQSYADIYEAISPPVGERPEPLAARINLPLLETEFRNSLSAVWSFLGAFRHQKSV